ncbi:c-type cytochrome [Cohaesibacter celericrescens]|uniref:Cytochrome c family protein n=1 Tax=Cohaesibacter celericrescens TaxID=2067669 RepID=A0A2N5XKZ5_9HYPH|nr:cytochrome c family protein [Cohaesibacter celericrescens]PLW75162.1 cytochrome c family protein [Cohaesibacter celericrescens]
MKRFVAVAGMVILASAGAALAEGDAEKGEKVFKKCKACHQVGDKAKNKVGPELNEIVGRKIASVEGFKYSKAFIAKAEEEPDFVWDEANIDTYLTKPKDFIKKNKMAFAGLKKEKDRENVIAYLKTFSKPAE